MTIHSLPAWLAYVALALCIGHLACRLWVLAPEGRGEAEKNLLSRAGPLFCISIAVMTAASMIDLLVRAVDMSGRPVMEAAALLPAILSKTHYGSVWLLRMGALLSAAAVMIAAGRRRDSRGSSVFALAAFIVAAMTESASGHAADAGDFSLPEVMDLLHLLAACVWGGGLFALSFRILPSIEGLQEDRVPVLAGVAARFSRMAGVAVAVAVFTAVYNSRQYVGGYRALTASPYGWIVLVKAVIFIALLQLGGMNRYVNVPLLQRWAGMGSSGEGLISRIAVRMLGKVGWGMDGHAAALRFRRSVRAEALLMVAVLLCAAMLRHEMPARHYIHMAPGGGMSHSMGEDNGGQRPPARHDHPRD